MKFFDRLKAHWFFLLCLLSAALLFLYFAWHDDMVEGGADNDWHYFISRYAFHYPRLFLDHWGKPLFVLLSSPFSQFGFFGTQVFNILCGLLAVVVSYMILQHFNISFKWAIAPLILFCPVYGALIQTALTEPLFSLVLITGVYFFLKERYVAGALILSFLMFSRSEGFFMLLYFVLFLAVQQRWKAIPFAFTGFFVYAVIGAVAGQGFWWFFIQNPYAYKSPYGHGEWLHFFYMYKEIWGLPFLVALGISVIILVWIFIKRRQFVFWKPLAESGSVFYLVFMPSVVFTAFHVTVWRFGLCGSMGLVRVLCCIIPLYAIVVMWSMNRLFLSRFPKPLSFMLVVPFLYFHICTMFGTHAYPRGAWGPDKAELEASRWFKTIMPEKCFVYFSHPGIIRHLNRDPFDRDRNFEDHSINCKDARPVPTYVFWDSGFSKVSREDVEQCGYRKLKEFHDMDFTLVVYEVK